MSPEWVQTTVTVAAFLIAAITVVISSRSRVHKAAADETARLADVRGEHIKDLEHKVSALENRLSELEGELKVMRELKAREIADAVVARIKEVE